MRAVWVCRGVVSRCCHGEASRFPSLSLPLSAVLISLDKVADHSRRSMDNRVAFSLSFGGGENLLHDDVGGKDGLPGVWSLIQMCDSESISMGHLEQLAPSRIPSIEPTCHSAASPSTLWVSVVSTSLSEPCVRAEDSHPICASMPSPNAGGTTRYSLHFVVTGGTSTRPRRSRAGCCDVRWKAELPCLQGMLTLSVRVIEGKE